MHENNWSVGVCLAHLTVPMLHWFQRLICDFVTSGNEGKYNFDLDDWTHPDKIVFELAVPKCPKGIACNATLPMLNLSRLAMVSPCSLQAKCGSAHRYLDTSALDVDVNPLYVRVVAFIGNSAVHCLRLEAAGWQNGYDYSMLRCLMLLCRSWIYDMIYIYEYIYIYIHYTLYIIHYTLYIH